MTIEKTTNSAGSETIRMTECPVCGEQLPPDNRRVLHLAKHDTTDFNLSERWEQ